MKQIIFNKCWNGNNLPTGLCLHTIPLHVQVKGKQCHPGQRNRPIYLLSQRCHLHLSEVDGGKVSGVYLYSEGIGANLTHHSLRPLVHMAILDLVCYCRAYMVIFRMSLHPHSYDLLV